MTEIYVRWIRMGRFSPEDVPLLWREKVRQALKEEKDDTAGAADR